MYKKYYKTRKQKFIKNKTKINKTKTTKENKDEYTQVLNAIMVFDYKTDWDQVFNSKEERQKHLDENIKSLRQSIDKYIQKRSENINKAMIKS
jgi:hypothetical protein